MSDLEKDSVKASGITVQMSAPIIAFVALPLIFLSFLAGHGFKDDLITTVLLSLISLIVCVFLVLVSFKPENLTLDGKSHFDIRKIQERRKPGGTV